MDSTTKTRKGFMKGKMGIMPFHRATKPSTTVQPYTTTTKTVKSGQKTMNPPSTTSLIMNQEKVNPPPKQKVSYMIPQTTGTYGVFDNPYGVVVDEAVDAKAAIYISCVQERFRLEHVNTEWMEQAS